MACRCQGSAFEAALHVATLVSVLVVYRQKVLSLARGCVRTDGESTRPYLLKLALASVPAGVVGLGAKDFFAARFDDPLFAGTMLLVTGSVVWSTRWARGQARGWPCGATAPTTSSGPWSKRWSGSTEPVCPTQSHADGSQQDFLPRLTPSRPSCHGG